MLDNCSFQLGTPFTSHNELKKDGGDIIHSSAFRRDTTGKPTQNSLTGLPTQKHKNNGEIGPISATYVI